jgi:hypothetical protein
MKHGLLLLFVVFMLFETAEGQIYRFRLSANSGIFLGEAGKAEVKPPVELNYEESEDFKSVLKTGLEFEIIRPYTRDFELGLQLGLLNLAGHTPTAPLYNFFLSRYNPLPNSNKYPDEALIYETKLLNVLGTARWYFLPYSKELNIFMKFFGGVTFTGSDFTFADKRHRIQYDVGVLHARGTKSSEYPKMAGITGGAGLGAAWRLSDKFDVYLDISASGIHSDLVNGVPNYNYVNNEGKTSMQRTNTVSVISQGSLGVIYSAVPDRRISKNNITRSSHISRNKSIKKSPHRKNRRR